jgi:pantoate--beta-alanine ligase
MGAPEPATAGEGMKPDEENARGGQVVRSGVKRITTQREMEEVRPGTSVVVPTMGALHEGHASLIRAGAALARERGLSGGCVVTVFVNPTQFNEPSDFARYPRTLEADAAMCAAAGASVVFAPEVEEVYPKGAEVEVPPLPSQATRPGLEDRLRPGHFAGVCQVVLRLFRMVRPAAAMFGEKDWQQLQVVRAMTREQGLSIEIIGRETIREADGLAMSSRNRFLSLEDRARGLSLSRALRAASAERGVEAAEACMRAELAKERVEADYAVVRDAETLEAWQPGRAGRALIAARVGTVRLIDNATWG